jgi:hypothetical protein
MAIEQTVVINTDTKSLSALKTEIKEIQAQLDLTPKGTKEYDDLVVRLRQAKGEIKDFKEATKGLDPDQRAAKLVNAFQGMTGAIQAAAGAVTLFGGAGEDLQKVEKNLLGIIAIGGGIQQTIEGFNDAIDVIGPAFTGLGQTIKAGFIAGATGAQTFKAALISTGIGALIVAVGLLIANFDSLFNSTENAKKAVDDLNESLERELDLIDDLNRRRTNDAKIEEERLKSLGATEEQLSELRRKNYIRDRDAAIASVRAINLAQDKALAVFKGTEEEKQKLIDGFNTKRQQAIVDRNNAETALEIEKLAAIQKANDKAEERRKKIEQNRLDRAKNEAEAIRNLNETERQFFLEQEKTDADRANREFTNTLERLREQKQQELNQLNLTEVAKQAIRDKYNKLEQLAEQKNAADLARIAAEANQKQLADNLKQIEEDFATVSSLEDATGRERQRRLNEQSRTIEEALKETLTEIDDIYELSRNAINETILQTTDPQALEALNAQLLALDEKYLDDRSNAFKKAATDIINIEELKAQKIAELDDIILDGAKSLLSDLSTLNQNYAQGNEAAQKQAFEQQKAFATVSAIIDTYLAAQKAFTSQIIPGDPSSLFRAQVAAGVAIAVGLARVAVIRSQQFNNPNTGGGGGSAGGSVGGGGGGGAAGGGGGGLFGEFTGTVLPPRLAPPSGGGDRADTTGQFQQGGVTTPIVRAYVLSGDVTDAQTADIKLQQKRKL